MNVRMEWAFQIIIQDVLSDLWLTPLPLQGVKGIQWLSGDQIIIITSLLLPISTHLNVMYDVCVCLIWFMLV